MPEDDENVRSLPVGTEIFHGTSAKGFLTPRGPAFFGDTYSVAKNFTSWHRGEHPRVLRFEVTQEIPRLALIETKEDFDRLAEDLGLEDRGDTESRVEMVCGAGYDGWIIPNNYPDGADIMLCEPARWLKFLDEERI